MGWRAEKRKPGIPKTMPFVGDNFIAANGIFHIGYRWTLSSVSEIIFQQPSAALSWTALLLSYLLLV